MTVSLFSVDAVADLPVYCDELDHVGQCVFGWLMLASASLFSCRTKAYNAYFL